MSAPLPKNETQRLKALHEYKVLDSMPEEAYDDIVRLAAYICKTPMALVSLIDSDRQWFKARVGVDAEQTSRDVAFCAHAILEPSDVMVVPDATRDARFAANPLVTDNLKIRFYAGAPLVTPSGEALGTLCAIDRVPRELDTEQQLALRLLSREVMTQLELRRSIASMEDVILGHEEYVRQLEDYQRQMEESQAQLQAQSVTDGLTGIHNRRAFQSRLEEEFSRARRHGSTVSLIMADVDHFKSYNDGFGHPAGDEVLKTVAKILQAGIRNHDFLGRYGGEEFVVILPSTGREGALVMGERFRRGIQRASWSQRPVTASFGVAVIDAGMATAEDLLGAADRALYASKDGGRNRVSLAA